MLVGGEWSWIGFALLPLIIKQSGGGFRLFSSSKPGRPLGPVRASKEAVMEKDEARVRFFKNVRKSKGGKGSLRAKVKKKSLLKKG